MRDMHIFERIGKIMFIIGSTPNQVIGEQFEEMARVNGKIFDLCEFWYSLQQHSLKSTDTLIDDIGIEIIAMHYGIRSGERQRVIP